MKVDEGTLDDLGEILLFSGREQDAITVYLHNVQEYPKSAGAYDSLGEAYKTAGQRDLAIRNFEMSLQRDPKNQNAIDAIKKLKEMK